MEEETRSIPHASTTITTQIRIFGRTQIYHKTIPQMIDYATGTRLLQVMALNDIVLVNIPVVMVYPSIMASEGAEDLGEVHLVGVGEKYVFIALTYQFQLSSKYSNCL